MGPPPTQYGTGAPTRLNPALRVTVRVCHVCLPVYVRSYVCRTYCRPTVHVCMCVTVYTYTYRRCGSPGTQGDRTPKSESIQRYSSAMRRHQLFTTAVSYQRGCLEIDIQRGLPETKQGGRATAKAGFIQREVFKVKDPLME